MSIGGETSRTSWRGFAVAYLIAQALSGVVWWALLLASATFRSWFELSTDRHGVLDAFLIADATVFIGGSVVSAWAIRTRWRWQTVVAAATAGGLAYATLLLASWVAFEGSRAAGLVPMLLATGATTAIAIATAAEERP